MNLGAVFCVGNLTCSFHMLHTWPTQFYVGPPTSTFLATLVAYTVRFSSDFEPNSDSCDCFLSRAEFQLCRASFFVQCTGGNEKR